MVTGCGCDGPMIVACLIGLAIGCGGTALILFLLQRRPKLRPGVHT